MGHFVNARSSTLLLLFAAIFTGTSSTLYVTSQNSGRCYLMSEKPFTASVDYTHNGQTYTATQTFDEYRGYGCKQGPSSSTRLCESSNYEPHTIDVPTPTGGGLTSTTVGGLTAKMCMPTAFTNQTRSVTVNHSGTNVVVLFTWSNITSCRCLRAWSA